MEIGTPAKKLSELRVIDLKQELEKRGLEKTGVKAALLERLKKALEEEDKNPDEYLFEVQRAKKKSGEDSSLEDSAIEDEVLDNKKVESLDIEGNSLEKEDEGNGCEEDAIEILFEAEDNIESDVKEKPGEQESSAMGGNVAPKNLPTKTESERSGIVPSQKITPAEEDANKENCLGEFDSAPPTPTSAPVVAPFTSEDTVKLHNSEKKDDDLSLIVNVDETPNEFDLPDPDSTAGEKCDIDNGKILEKAMLDAEKDFANNSSLDDVVAGKAEDGKKAEKEETSEKAISASTPTVTPIKPTRDHTTTGEKEETNKDTSTPGKDSKAPPKKVDLKSKGSVNSRNLWISGLSTSTRATDLKALFSKYGKVAGAKVVTNARSPGSRCYGFVSMNTAEEASKCIQYLHRTELHGRMISVERAKTDPSQAKAAAVAKKAAGVIAGTVQNASQTQNKPDEQKLQSADPKAIAKKPEKKDVDKKDTTADKKEEKVLDSRRPDRRHRDGHTRTYRRKSKSPVRSRSRHGSSKRPDSKEKDKRQETKTEKSEDKKETSEKKEEKAKEDGAKKSETEEKKDDKKNDNASQKKDSKDADKKDTKKSKEKELLSLEKIKEERERERLRQRERRLREEERRRREQSKRENQRQREIMARQREEAVRLQRERDRLKVEREKLEREKLEAEREKVRLERERRERERLELVEQRRLEALRYEERQRALKRPYDNKGAEDYWGEPKRANYDQREGRYGDYEPRQGPNAGTYTEPNRGGDGYARSFDRHDRNAPRHGERDNRPGYDRRDEVHRGVGPHSAVPVRRDGPRGPGGRDGGAPGRDRDDRNHRLDDRYNKYENERESRQSRDSGPASRDHERREPARRVSPHRGGPIRSSPAHQRRSDNGPSQYSRPVNDRRPSRERTHDNRTNTDRPYSGSHAGSSQRGDGSGDWQQNSSLARDSKDRSYARTGGPAPGVLVNHKPVEQSVPMGGTWAPPDRRPVTMIQQTTDPRGWTSMNSMTQRPVVNPQMVQVQQAPATNAFLASAANIMIGAGLAQRGTDTRYDAYKALQNNVRRY